MSSGLLYCATLDTVYLVQAYLSAKSALDYLGTVPIALFTDQPNHPLAKQHVFTHVHNIELTKYFNRPWVTGKFARIEALRRSPFDRTLHLDCDTRVMDSDVGSIFSLLDSSEIALAECSEETSYTRRHYGEQVFNGGVIAYRLTRTIKRLLKAWQSLTAEQHDYIGTGNFPDYLAHVAGTKQKNRLLGMDQVSLAQLLSPNVNVFNAQVKILDRSWNERRRPEQRPENFTVRIDHSPHHHNSAIGDLLWVAFEAVQNGDSPTAELLYASALDVVNNAGQLCDDYDGVEANNVSAGNDFLSRLLSDSRIDAIAGARELAEKAMLHALHGQSLPAEHLTKLTAQIMGITAPNSLPFSTAIRVAVHTVRPNRKKRAHIHSRLSVDLK